MPDTPPIPAHMLLTSGHYTEAMIREMPAGPLLDWLAWQGAGATVHKFDNDMEDARWLIFDGEEINFWRTPFEFPYKRGLPFDRDVRVSTSVEAALAALEAWAKAGADGDPTRYAEVVIDPTGAAVSLHYDAIPHRLVPIDALCKGDMELSDEAAPDLPLAAARALAIAGLRAGNNSTNAKEA